MNATTATKPATTKKSPVAKKAVVVIPDRREGSAVAVKDTLPVANTVHTTGRKPDIASDIFKDTLTINFSNGKVIEVDVSKLSPEIQKQAMLHGLKQKLVDAAAIARNTDTGQSATITEKYEAVKEVADRVTGADATWNKVREAGASASGSSSLLARALVEVSGKSRADIDAYLESKSKEEKAALKLSAKIAPVILRLQAAGNKSDVDGDALLADLM